MMDVMKEKSGTLKQGGVVLGKFKKTSVMINSNGDEVNPITKEVIAKKEVEQ